MTPEVKKALSDYFKKFWSDPKNRESWKNRPRQNNPRIVINKEFEEWHEELCRKANNE